MKYSATWAIFLMPKSCQATVEVDTWPREDKKKITPIQANVGPQTTKNFFTQPVYRLYPTISRTC